MPRIRILSEQLANQIAAGEVVERPASVVKELVENSVDAGAERIDVTVENGGVRLIRVVDDGCGMLEDDVLLCLERHATSKLQDESQLNAIVTLGFRGEAIPSIASVSQMTILSRAEGKLAGTRAELRYGVLHDVREEGCRTGTIIEIRNLFGNVPARKKFLKSTRTELSHIEEVIINQALASPAIGFSLSVDGRRSVDLPPGSDLEARVRDLFRYRGALLSLEHSGSMAGDKVQVGGYLLLPETSPARSAKLRILVNGRAVVDRVIRHAVIEGLQSFLLKGYQPAGVVILSLPPDQVDVNVHPAKREIRFKNSGETHRVVAEVVKTAMAQHQEFKRSELFGRAPGQAPLPEPDFPAAVAAEPGPHSLSSSPDVSESISFPRTPTAPASKPIQESLVEQARPFSVAPQHSWPQAKAGGNQARVASFAAPAAEQRELHDYAGITYIGTLFELYLLCEKQGHFIVIDQHAAHERILYGQLKKGYMEKQIPQQNLLFPVTVELDLEQIEIIDQYEERLPEFGLDAAHFGDSTWVIKAVPASLSSLDPGQILSEILVGLRSQGRAGGNIVGETLDHILATMACKAAVKGGMQLEPEEIIGLLRQMEQSEVFSHCPHGRPVMKSFDAIDVEKWFHRHGG